MVIAVACALIVQWRPSVATNDPYATVQARWTVEHLEDPKPFVGLGVFVFRPNWEGPAQEFPGPVLLQVQDAEAPVRIRFDGEVAVVRASSEGGPVLTTNGAGGAPATPTTNEQELTLGLGDLVAVPARTTMSVTTGEGESVRFLAVAILPNGPPATPGIQQTEWRAWGKVDSPLGLPVVVTVADVELAGGEAYRFGRERGPALLSVEGTGDGAQSIALNVTKGRGVYQRVADVPPFDLDGPVSYKAVQTPTSLNRERVFEGRSGAYLPPGTTASIRNRSLVDGTGVVMVTFDGPNVVTPAPTPTVTPLGTRPAV